MHGIDSQFVWKDIMRDQKHNDPIEVGADVTQRVPATKKNSLSTLKSWRSCLESGHQVSHVHVEGYKLILPSVFHIL